MKYLLILSFVGTHYDGWQVQPGLPTIQKTLQIAAETAFREPVAVTGCGRTDSGVHARAFPCTIQTQSGRMPIPPEVLPEALNRLLPGDLALQSASAVPDSFHPRYTPHIKEYEYLIYNGRRRDPFFEGRAYFFPRPLHLSRMQLAADAFCGTQDFTAFMAAGSKITDAVRTVYRTALRRDGNLVSFTVSGNGFLYNMVRIMTGTLLAVSEEKIRPEQIPDILASRDRARAGATVPAWGLYLNRVTYLTDQSTEKEESADDHGKEN